MIEHINTHDSYKRPRNIPIHTVLTRHKFKANCSKHRRTMIDFSRSAEDICTDKTISKRGHIKHFF